MTSSKSTETAQAAKPGSYKITKADLNQVNRRSLFGFQLGWNYERMQGSGYLFCMLPILRRIYGDGSPELRQMMRTENQLMNTSNFFINFVFGIDMAIQEEQHTEGEEAVVGIKTGLMGPFAGVGDSIFGVIIPTIFGSIAAYQALEGSPVGSVLWICMGFVVLALRWWMFKLGVAQGQSAIETISENMKPITDAASILGLVVVGALVCSVVSIKAPGTFAMGDVQKPVQDLLDGIMPALLPLLGTAGVYALLGKKGMTSNKAILIVIVVGLVLGCLGILSK